MSNKILLLIDLQEQFYSSKKESLLKVVKNEINKAKSNNYPIICLRYYGCGDFHKSLLDEIGDYMKKYEISKSEDDGSKEVVELCEKISFTSGEIIVCGVNTDACVKQTVLGLKIKTDSSYDIHIVENGCWAGCADWHNKEIHNLKKDFKIVYSSIRKHNHIPFNPRDRRFRLCRYNKKY
jgi:nicotinamidase-related amidase